MTPREKSRLIEIDRRLTDLASMAPHAFARYHRARQEREALERELARLRAERADLEQGQLMLYSVG